MMYLAASEKPGDKEELDKMIKMIFGNK